MAQQSSPLAKWVFISHASGDRKVADSLCRALEGRGLPCWIATRDIPPGENYQDCIVQAIERADAMVLVFTVSCNNSSEIKKEVALAGQFVVPVIPVRVEDVAPSGAFRYELINRQWIDLFSGWDHALDKIISKVGEIGKDLPVRDTQPVRSREPRYPGRSRRLLFAAATALVLLAAGAASVFLFAGPRDADAQFPETASTRLTAFTLCTPPNEYKAGFRKWVRVTPDRWTQAYPDGSTEYLNVIGRTRVGDCDGSILRTNLDANFQIFLPDTNCSDMEFMFRRLPKRIWDSYVHMEDINSASRACAK